MTESGEAKELLNKAIDLDLDIVLVLGIREEGGSVLLHNVDTDLDASFLLKTFVATLDMSILEEIYERSKAALN